MIVETLERLERLERKLDQRLDRIDARLGSMESRVTDMEKALIRQGQILDEHQRRSLANEEAVDLLRVEIAPIKTHVAMWAGAWKVVVVVGSLAGIAATALKLWG